ncbi:MAG: acyl-CoA dehydratase activase [Acidobacteriota bacterium]
MVEKLQHTEASRRVYCGVDVGASATKLVLIDDTRSIKAHVAMLSGVDYDATSKAALETALSQVGAGKDEVAYTVSTGYGRDNVSFARESITEIHCHGVGCYHYFPRAITIIDIGGQDNKVIRLDAEGRRLGFKMNRKCAAGTGAFIEEIALRLGIPLSDMDRLARSTSDAVQLSSFCTVFAKTEVLSHLRRGVPVERIVRGTFLSVIHRVVEMDPMDGEVVLTGGVVEYNPTVADIFAQKLGRGVTVPPRPQLTGALGAAILASTSGNAIRIAKGEKNA